MNMLLGVSIIVILCDIALAIRCPEQCRCHKDANHYVRVNCAHSGLTTVPTVDQLDPTTAHLDLSDNHITELHPDALKGLYELTEVILDDNSIREIHAFAFRGMTITKLSMRRSGLKILKTNSFSGIKSRQICDKDNDYDDVNNCVIDLNENNIEMIESNAFAWVNGLEIHIGKGSVPLVISPYAFYGIMHVPMISISDLPSLALQPRAFTNAEHLKRILVNNIGSLDALEPFTFEGLKGITEIVFSKVHFVDFQSYAFSGTQFNFRSLRDTGYTLLDPDGSPSKTGCSGAIRFKSCVMDKLPTDAFKDTMLAQLTIESSTIAVIEANTFRDLPCLKRLYLTENSVTDLQSEGLGSLKEVQEVNIHNNEITNLKDKTFKGSEKIGSLSFHLKPTTQFTIESYAFSELYVVNNLLIKGHKSNIVTIQPDAFSNLVDVSLFHIQDVTVNSLVSNSLRGPVRVKEMAFSNTGLTHLEQGVIGTPEPTQGGVERLNMSTGNELPCDCDTKIAVYNIALMVDTFDVKCRDQKGWVEIDSKNVDLRGCRHPGTLASRSNSIYTCTVLNIFLCLMSVITYIAR